MLYSAAYALIRLGSVVEQHRRKLEQVSPDCLWQDWIDRRDDLAKQINKVAVDEIARVVTAEGPRLVRYVTSAEPDGRTQSAT